MRSSDTELASGPEIRNRSHDARRPCYLTAGVVVKEEFGEAGGPGQQVSKDPGIKKSRALVWGRNHRKGRRKLTLPGSSPCFSIPGIPGESPTALAAWAGSTLVGWWS